MAKEEKSKGAKKWKGLSEHDVHERRKKYGFNEVKQEERSAFGRFLEKFVGPIPIMIEIALVLSAVMERWEDFTIIALLLCVNIGVDFAQEQKATRALAALKKTLTPRALVVRDGVVREISARELVPGDIIKLNIGDIVPADAEVLGGIDIAVDQSSMTGESLPVNKGKGDVLFASSVVVRGRMWARVTAIGAATSIGINMQLVSQAAIDERSHFQRAIVRIGVFLIVVALIMVIITFIVLFVRGTSFVETLRFALVLAIASVPVALPTVLSVTMAIGAHILAKSKAIVANFTAIEELAGTDVLCVDKTGTLTKNELSIAKPIVYGRYTERDLFIDAQLASEKENQSPIERAIAHYAAVHGYVSDARNYVIDKFIPFNPTSKVTRVRAHNREHTRNIIMCAPQILLERLQNAAVRTRVSDDIDTFARNGFRTLALGEYIDNDTLEPVGLVPLLDPPREDSARTVERVRAHHITLKMLTGDHAKIARYIAELIGIGTRVVRAKDIRIKDDGIDAKAVMRNDVFAEVAPRDKYDIVAALQSKGHIVAMTGDGVNDAPALKKADVGIAVSGASEAARTAADLILLDKGLSVIEHAIRLARTTFARMQAYATFRIAETIRVIFFISLATIFFGDVPLTAIMIILLALLNDIPVMAIAYDNAPPDSKPVRWHLPETLFIATILGVTGLISSFLLLWYTQHVLGWSLAMVQTAIFLKLDVSGHSTLYTTRTGRYHFWHKPFPSLAFFVPAFSSRIIGTIFALGGFFMAPLGWDVVVAIWLYSTVWFILNDTIKVWAYKVFHTFYGKSKVQSS